MRVAGFVMPCRTFVWIIVPVHLACSSARVSSEQSGGPSLVWPAHFAEGDAGAGRPPDEPAERSATEERKPPTFQPDPEPLAAKKHYEYLLVYDRGQIRVARVKAVEFEKDVSAVREMGRFAIELWIGHELVERVRFDFPMLAAEPAPTGPRRPLDEPPSLAAGARVTRTVRVPASPRATSARLVDRATGRVTDLPWPPEAPLDAPTRTPAQ